MLVCVASKAVWHSFTLYYKYTEKRLLPMSRCSSIPIGRLPHLTLSSMRGCWYTFWRWDCRVIIQDSKMFTPSISVLVAIVVLIDATTVLVSGATDRDDHLYFSLIVSGTPTLKNVKVIHAVDKALELIQNDSTMLPGYHLSYSHVLNVQVSCI